MTDDYAVVVTFMRYGNDSPEHGPLRWNGVFQAEFGSPVGTIASWPKTIVFGHSNERIKKPFKINNGCASVAQGFWPVSQVAHVPANRCHIPYRTYAFALNDQLGKRNYLSK
jgi:hypothetical protein